LQLLQLLKLLRSRLRHRHPCIFRASAAATPAMSSTRSTLGLALAAGVLLVLTLAAGVLLVLALATTAKLQLLKRAYHARLAAPQLSGLAGPVQLPDDGVWIHQARHRHLPLLCIYAALVHTCMSIQHISLRKKTNLFFYN
jgi:hypothetical protein